MRFVLAAILLIGTLSGDLLREMKYNKTIEAEREDNVMDYKKELIRTVETFYIDVVEEFKEAELRISADSKFSRIFKKKNYGANIDLLRACKKQALDLDTGHLQIPKADQDGAEILKLLNQAIRRFMTVCDTHVQLQVALQKKANKEELKFSEYREIFRKAQESRTDLNDTLQAMDAVYANYAYNEDGESYLDAQEIE